MEKQYIKKIGKALANNIKTTDLILVCMVLIASSLSFVLISSLYFLKSISSWRPVFIQAITTLIGFSIALIISNIDYHKIVKMWKLIAITSCSFSLLLFAPIIGNLRGGNNLSGVETGSDNLNWFNLGFTKLQPSEFLKIAFIITFSFHCSMVLHKINEPKTFIKLIAHAMVPVLIIFLQKDYGTMLIFLFIAACLLFVSRINWKIIAAVAIVSGVALTFFLSFAMSDSRLKRFAALGNIEAFKDGVGWQQYRGVLALACGKIYGKGFFSDEILTDVPELYNDMIFAHIGQTLGFVGCVAVLIWICCFCFRIIQHGKNAQDNLGYLICIGCFSLIFIQAVINIGMVLRITPVIGVTLPFISAGGSSNLSSYMLLGLILSIHRHSFKPTLFQ